MLVHREWNDHPELLEAIVEPLCESGLDVLASTEQSSYRDDGSVRIVFQGRCFYVQLKEEL